MALNKEKVMSIPRRRVKGLKLAKPVKRAMAFMTGPMRRIYMRMMLDAYHTYDVERRKSIKEKKES